VREAGRAGAVVGKLARPLDGCVRRNHARDVLDVMDALEIDFMPLVDDFGGRKVIGVITRWELARILRRSGSAGRVEDGTAVLLPMVSEDTPVGHVEATAGKATAYVVVDADGSLKGIYRPAYPGAQP
jgi:CBS domain-containing protein